MKTCHQSTDATCHRKLAHEIRDHVGLLWPEVEAMVETFSDVIPAMVPVWLSIRDRGPVTLAQLRAAEEGARRHGRTLVGLYGTIGRDAEARREIRRSAFELAHALEAWGNLLEGHE